MRNILYILKTEQLCFLGFPCQLHSQSTNGASDGHFHTLKKNLGRVNYSCPGLQSPLFFLFSKCPFLSSSPIPVSSLFYSDFTFFLFYSFNFILVSSPPVFLFLFYSNSTFFPFTSSILCFLSSQILHFLSLFSISSFFSFSPLIMCFFLLFHQTTLCVSANINNLKNSSKREEICYSIGVSFLGHVTM